MEIIIAIYSFPLVSLLQLKLARMSNKATLPYVISKNLILLRGAMERILAHP
jgi:hypothetical protein